jgi:hypothetical protein
MKAKVLLPLGVIVTAASLMSWNWNAPFNAKSADSFFPLQYGLTWTYRMVDRNRSTSEIFTDRVIRQRDAGDANGAGEVESQYSGPTGKFSSITIYVPERGYLTRQSNAGQPAWVLFAEREFLPQLLKPDLSWSNVLAPFDHQEAGAFQVSQQHHTFFEPKDVVVPAGRFSGCIRIETDAVYRGDSEEHRMELRYLDWYAPHVGLVKTVVLNSGWFGSEVSHVELLSFHNAESHDRPRLISSVSRPAVE